MPFLGQHRDNKSAALSCTALFCSVQYSSYSTGCYYYSCCKPDLFFRNEAALLLDMFCTSALADPPQIASYFAVGSVQCTVFTVYLLKATYSSATQEISLIFLQVM